MDIIVNKKRALNKSQFRASIRPIENSTRSLNPLNQSVTYHARKSMTPKDLPRNQEITQENGAGHSQQHPLSSTKGIIQHFNTLSNASKLSSSLHRVRRYGTTAHRVEKKPLLNRPASSISHNLTQERGNSRAETIIPTGRDQMDLSSIDSLATTENAKIGMTGSLFSSRTSTSKASNTFTTKYNHQARVSNITSTKKQEEIYLLQTRLMQWHLMSKKVAQHFMEQEKSAEMQFESVGRLLLEKQTKLHNIQKRFEVEQDLVELESTLGYQRDQLLSIIEGLDTIKSEFEEFTAALDSEARVLRISGIDNNNLDQWLEKINECRDVLNVSSLHSEKNYELVQGVARIMQELCAIVKEEIQEIKECATLAAKLREAETIEASLLCS
ncbi:hypothetical protein FBU30_010350 [Linnemannia zychae]|nr:hypothetical protein FBU30_010350 [Linnemannia zychae]